MNYINMGKSGLNVSQLGLACIDLGTPIQQEQAFRIIDAYREIGGNLLDTANNYAFWNGGDGRDSERVLGQYILQNPSERENIVLCTKLGALPTDLSAGFAAMQGNGRRTIFEEVEKSLETMHTSYIDLLYLHVDDFNTELEETMSSLNELIEKGYVRNIGCSNFYTWRIEQARQICIKNGYKFFCAVQQRNSYLKPVIDADFDVQVAAGPELLSYIDTYKDLTLVSYAPLLHGAYARGVVDDVRYQTQENEERMNRIKGSGMNPNAFVLKNVIEESNGVALFTSSDVNHLKINMDIWK